MDFNTRYEFNPKKDLLGKGGFSKVYKANDTLLDRTVALKFFTGGGAEKYQVLNEIKKVIRFEHPNLCKYYDVAVLDSKNIVGESEQVEVGIMEYLDAGDFKTYVKNNPLSIDKLLIDVLKGMSYLHRKGIVHRDLKPQNIIIKIEDDEPVAKITDFGISKLISSDDNNSSALIGTIEYMAPEQFNPKKYGIGGKITTNLDLWSFGLLVYEALAHKPLFGSRSSGTSAEQVMRNILSDAYLAKTKYLPEKYKAIVDKCLVKDASKRVQHALELIPLFVGEPGWPMPTGGAPSAEMNVEDDLSEFPDDATALYEQDAYEDNDHTQTIDQQNDAALKNNEATSVNQEAEDQQTRLIQRQEEITDDATRVLNLADQAADQNTSNIQLAEETHDNATQLLDIGMRENAGEDETVVLQRPREVAPDLAEPPPVKPVIKPAPPPLQENKSIGNDANKRKKLLLYAAFPVVLLLIFFAFRMLNRTPVAVTETKKDTSSNHTTVQPTFAMPDLMPVEGGDFIMGNGTTDAIAAELPQHEVHLADFSIGKYETTIGQFRQFINETKYITTAEKEGQSDVYENGKSKWKTEAGVNWRHDIYGKIIDSSIRNVPVIHVSWFDADEYCKWLSARTNKHVRLPTEAEWEYAAGGGTRSKVLTYSGSDNLDEVAWTGKNAGSQVHPVGTKKPNELGIYDMSGNVMEWCNDWYDENYYKVVVPNDPKGPGTGINKVARGGSWYSEEKVWFYNATRGAFKPNKSGSQVGFRICETKN